MNNREIAHSSYEKLVSRLPDFFVNQHGIEYVLDSKKIHEWEDATGETIGVIYESEYEILVVDLINKNGKLKSHGRIILPNNGVIIIPKVGDKFVLEDQYRYPICQSFLAFPRGHCEPNSTPRDDAIREVKEELGGADIHNLRYIGKTYPETHSNAWFCSVWLGEVDEKSLKLQKGFEGIDNLVLLSESQINEKIAKGEISCGYTLAAWALYCNARLD